MIMKKTYIVPVVSVLALRPMMHILNVSNPNVTFGGDEKKSVFDTKEDNFWDED